jgi:hypothetical protein
MEYSPQSGAVSISAHPRLNAEQRWLVASMTSAFIPQLETRPIDWRTEDDFSFRIWLTFLNARCRLDFDQRSAAGSIQTITSSCNRLTDSTSGDLSVGLYEAGRELAILKSVLAVSLQSTDMNDHVRFERRGNVSVLYRSSGVQSDYR